MSPDPTPLPPMTRDAYRGLIDSFDKAGQRLERAYQDYANCIRTDRLLTVCTYEMRIGGQAPTITQIAARRELLQNGQREIQEASAAMDAAERDLNRAVLRQWSEE